MARPLRLQFENAVYHVMARGHERSQIFRSDSDFDRFLHVLADVVRDHGWYVHAYCLMPNHYHLLLETPRGRLSEGMRGINGRYAQWFNNRHERTGHLFESRFRSILVDKEAYLLELTRYIVLNPVRAGLCHTPEDWRWSNFRATAGLASGPEWLESNWTLSQFSRHRRAAHEVYWRFVREGMNEDPTRQVVGHIYLGRQRFLSRMQSLVSSNESAPEVPRAQREPFAVSLSRIRTLVSERWLVSEESLGRRRAGEAKVAAIWLALRVSGHSAVAVGRAFGVKRGRVSNIEREVALGKHRHLLPLLREMQERLRGEGGTPSEPPASSPSEPR
jgi:REP element-mobilizing transposase RayT